METILRQNLMETILLVKVICTKGYAQSDGTIGWKISMYKFKDKGSIMKSAESCGIITFVRRHSSGNLANIMDHIGERYHL